jgi:hypothetical protein
LGSDKYRNMKMIKNELSAIVSIAKSSRYDLKIKFVEANEEDLKIANESKKDIWNSFNISSKTTYEVGKNNENNKEDENKKENKEYYRILKEEEGPSCPLLETFFSNELKKFTSFKEEGDNKKDEFGKYDDKDKKEKKEDEKDIYLNKNISEQNLKKLESFRTTKNKSIYKIRKLEEDDEIENNVIYKTGFENNYNKPVILKDKFLAVNFHNTKYINQELIASPYVNFIN